MGRMIQCDECGAWEWPSAAATALHVKCGELADIVWFIENCLGKQIEPFQRQALKQLLDSPRTPLNPAGTRRFTTRKAPFGGWGGKPLANANPAKPMTDRELTVAYYTK